MPWVSMFFATQIWQSLWWWEGDPAYHVGTAEPAGWLWLQRRCQGSSWHGIAFCTCSLNGTAFFADLCARKTMWLDGTLHLFPENPVLAYIYCMIFTVLQGISFPNSILTWRMVLYTLHYTVDGNSYCVLASSNISCKALSKKKRCPQIVTASSVQD